MSDFHDYLQEQLKDHDFKVEWDALQPELHSIQAVINEKVQQGLIQKYLSEKDKVGH